jgi:thioredoxin-related protein
MKRLTILLLVIFLMSLFSVSCKQGSNEKGSASIVDEVPEYIIDDEGNVSENPYVEGYLR